MRLRCFHSSLIGFRALAWRLNLGCKLLEYVTLVGGNLYEGSNTWPIIFCIGYRNLMNWYFIDTYFLKLARWSRKQEETSSRRCPPSRCSDQWSLIPLIIPKLYQNIIAANFWKEYWIVATMLAPRQVRDQDLRLELIASHVYYMHFERSYWDA